ncbi:MAG: hypothetical protein PHX78_12265, partial [bacterium]|nr:hypothetical protein [bacterium]
DDKKAKECMLKAERFAEDSYDWISCAEARIELFNDKIKGQECLLKAEERVNSSVMAIGCAEGWKSINDDKKAKECMLKAEKLAKNLYDRDSCVEAWLEMFNIKKEIIDTNNPISKAFGYRLGQKFEIIPTTENEKMQDGTPCYQIKPTKTFRKFNDYYVLITPKTHLIYSIQARFFRLDGGASKEKAVVFELLKDKYGYENVVDNDSIKIRNRGIMLFTTASDTGLYIVYADKILHEQAKNECISIEKSKTDSSDL